jgi:hypothetical protein
MLSGIIAYQVLQQESPQTIEKVRAVLEQRPWYGNQWQARLQDVPIADHGVVLFMQAARWAESFHKEPLPFFTFLIARSVIQSKATAFEST